MADTAVATKLRPLSDRIVVRASAREERSTGGIVLPDTATEKPQDGEVVAIGPGRLDDKGRRIPVEVTVGAKVLFAKYSGTECKVDGEELLILSERDILAIRS